MKHLSGSLGSTLWTCASILLGNAVLAFAIAAFTVPHGLIMGGVTGISLFLGRFLDLAVPGTWAATAVCGDRVGNPGLFCAALVPELRALQGDRGGRAVLNRRPDRLLRVPCAPEELQDIDTPADLP